MNIQKRISLSLIILAAVLLASAGIIVSQGFEPVPSGQEPLRATPVASDAAITARITIESGIFHDETARYSLKIPDGWIVGNYPGLFLSPDAEGLVGYADTKGMALMVDRSSKDATLNLSNWLLQTGEERFLTRPLTTLSAGDKPTLLYEANWDTQGNAITAFVDGRNSVLRISCFHPADAPNSPCLDILSQLLPTVRLDPTVQ